VIGGPITLCVDEPSYCARVKASAHCPVSRGDEYRGPVAVGLLGISDRLLGATR
jgi:hypothetical protein